MGIAAQQFEGMSTRIPGVYSKSEFPPSLGSVLAPTNVVAILGTAQGGVPYNASGKKDDEKINVITSVGQALNTLIGGPGFYMTEMFLSPSRDRELNNPSSVWFIRVNPATAASKTVKDGSANDIVDLVSNVYGVVANQIARKIEAGTTAGKKITVKYQGQKVSEKDDIAYNYITIQYVGAGTAASMTINATTLTVTVTGAPADDLSITLADFPRLDQLVAYINDQPSYTCVLAGPANSSSLTFDAVTGQDIKTATYTATANVQAVIDFFNNESGGLITASLHAAAARSALANDVNYIFMAGGGEGTTTNSDWSGALTLLEKFEVNHVLVATGDSTIHSMLANHVETMSNIENRKNRTAAVGAAITTSTKAARIAEAKGINSARVEYWATPFKRPDLLASNAAKVFDPFYASALGAGIRFGNFVTMSATFKIVNALGVEEAYSVQDKDDYINAGCSLMENTDRGIQIVHNVSTYQGSDRLILNLPSMIRTADFITIDMQKKLYVRMANMKRAPNALAIKDMENYIVTNLLPGYEVDGYITKDPNTDPPSPAFSDVEFKLVGDRFDVSFTAILPAPLHFIFVKQKFIVVGFNE